MADTASVTKSVVRRICAQFCFAVLVLGMATATCHAQNRKPTAQEVAAIRDCAKKHETNVHEGELRCLFNLVADPCAKTPEGSSNLGTADCFRVEWAIWDGLLNENYKALAADLDDQQTTKLREMQRAWIAYRDTTCEFYWTKIGGSMAVPMAAACGARETARRAMLLKFFSGL
jgi:uncharacterized protein YecT (DUF1311 family)